LTISSTDVIPVLFQTCYDSLIYNFDLSDTECVKYSISKGLGLGIVVGGSIVKLPQIGKIINSKSARGLSLSAYVRCKIVVFSALF
jgi:mannose-P-dolichol utilization defect protein 1